MHNTFLVFDFGANEDAAQHARHKLDGWRQAFRLDKKLLFKFEREEAAAAGDGVTQQPEKPEEKAAPKAKNKGKDVPKASAKTSVKQPENAEPSGDVKLLVRLYFSGHEKLSHQRWLDRIPTEEPFKSVEHRTVLQNEPEFTALEEKFQSLA